MATPDNILSLDAALRAVCPIDGISIGTWDDRATWRINHDASATSDQVAAAQAALAAYDPLKDSLKPYAAAKRYAVEVGGTVWSGHAIATDRDSQSKLIAELVSISAAIRTDPSVWKFADGSFANLSNADMGAVILQARAHVEAAFVTESSVCASIDANSITTTAQIDAAAWPKNS